LCRPPGFFFGVHSQLGTQSLAALGQDIFYYIAMDISQPKITPGVTVR